MPLQLISFFGAIACLLTAWLFSKRNSAIPWRIVLWGITLQIVLIGTLLVLPVGVQVFSTVGAGFTAFLAFSRSGAEFLFGNVIKPEYAGSFGFQVGLTILSTIIFFSSVVSVLYHLGVMQRVVRAAAWCMEKTMGTSGPESLSAAANIFLGQTEAPITIRSYLTRCSESELQAIMVGGFATIASSVMGAFVSFGISAQHLLLASLLAAPGSLLISKLATPPTGEEVHTFSSESGEVESATILEAATNGARDGLHLALNVLAMLLAFIALVAVVNAGLSTLHSWLPWIPPSLKSLLGIVFMPIAYTVGIDPKEAYVFAQLFGTKISLNEFVAYTDLSAIIKQGGISNRTITLCTIALCGFANISSIAIQIGGLGALAPDRKKDIARLGWRAMALGALTNLFVTSLCGTVIAE
ncbi:MAG: NupC/NupG family nucleoside CNT transporter [Candidatus Kapabacteria bacterium]|nr:NupC/NupG family nucleoside CNT transporter [Candidatus Kapabacteria bacterium]